MVKIETGKPEAADPMRLSLVGAAMSDPESSPRAGSTLGQSSVHFSSRTDDWATPWDLFNDLNREFGFTLDPCSSHQNAKCLRHFTVVEDGLSQDWSREVVFMNPPYGRAIARWMEKAFTSSRAGATVVCLVPARTDTRWWHSFAIHGKVRFLRGRVRFGESKTGAPFPSAVVIFEQATKTAQPRLSP